MNKITFVLFIFLLNICSIKSYAKEKIVIIQAERDEFVIEAKNKLLETLNKKLDNIEDYEICEFFCGEHYKNEKSFLSYDNLLEKMSEIEPRVILVVGANTDFLDKGIDKLQNLDYPVIINIWAERYVDEEGYAKKNITGVYMMSDKLQQNAFKLLNHISPLNEGKAVFLTGFKAFTKERVAKNIKESINGELEELESITYIEDLEEKMEKYNSRDDIAWILHGYNVVQYKDGKLITWVEALRKYNRKLQKKANVTYWETVVKEGGAVAGLCADIKEDGISVAEMGIELLNGKSISEIKARSPREQNIIVNLKNARDIGVEIPFDILAGSYRVYTDYDGNYIEQR